MASLPVVKVAIEGGYMVINESDYDPAVHQLLENDLETVLTEESGTILTVDSGTSRVEELIEENTVTALKAIAKEKGLKGYSRMNEQELAEAIASAEVDGE